MAAKANITGTAQFATITAREVDFVTASLATGMR